MIYLFLDTNVYLKFYTFSDTDLGGLDSILTHIESGELEIILPEQVENEFYRTREKKIKESIDDIQQIKIKNRLPKIGDSYDENKNILGMFRDINKDRVALIEKINSDAADYNLKADILITKVFEKSKKIVISDDIYAMAKKRFNLGNPPGKDKSYGDAVIWESLKSFDFGDFTLNFVSFDGDFACSLFSNNINKYLELEWKKEKQKSKLKFYTDFNKFFEDNELPIKIDEEFRKNKLINNLGSAHTFDDARYQLSKLSDYSFSDFNSSQTLDIIMNSLNNNQVYGAHYYNRKSWMGDWLAVLIDKGSADVDREIIEDFNEKFGYNLDNGLSF